MCLRSVFAGASSFPRCPREDACVERFAAAKRYLFCVLNIVRKGVLEGLMTKDLYIVIQKFRRKLFHDNNLGKRQHVERCYSFNLKVIT